MGLPVAYSECSPFPFDKPKVEMGSVVELPNTKNKKSMFLLVVGYEYTNSFSYFVDFENTESFTESLQSAKNYRVVVQNDSYTNLTDNPSLLPLGTLLQISKDELEERGKVLKGYEGFVMNPFVDTENKLVKYEKGVAVK